MNGLLAVVKKELRQIRRDPLSLGMLLGLPAFMLVLYGYALNFDVHHVALAVEDRDLGMESRELIAAFVNSTYFDTVATLGAGENLEELTERRVARAVLVVPEGFGHRLRAGTSSPVQLILDGADANTATTVLGYARAIVAEANAGKMAQALLRVGRRGAFGGIVYRPRVWYNPELSSTRFLVPGLMGFLLMITAVLSTALSVVREKERGTMEQLRMAPISTASLVVGKTLPYLAISLSAAVVVLGAARVLFGVVVQGSYFDLLVVTLVYLAAALGLGLLISTAVKSQAMAFQVGLLISMLPAILLSGFIFSIRAMPRPLQIVTMIVPARYYLVVLRGIILKGAGLSSYPAELGALSAFALIVLSLAAVRLARDEG